MATKSQPTAPIDIVGFEEDTNLREVSWNQKYLDGVKAEWKLKHCQAILYVNKAHDRFRLVVCFYGFALLMLPPVNHEERISLYLKVSQFLRRFAKYGDAVKLLDSEIESTHARIERRKKMAASAAKKRRRG